MAVGSRQPKGEGPLGKPQWSLKHEDGDPSLEDLISPGCENYLGDRSTQP